MPRLAVDPFTKRTVEAGTTIPALIHMHAVNAVTHEVAVDEIHLVHIPIEYRGVCDHTETICTEPSCYNSWSLDYVFDTV